MVLGNAGERAPKTDGTSRKSLRRRTRRRTLIGSWSASALAIVISSALVFLGTVPANATVVDPTATSSPSADPAAAPTTAPDAAAPAPEDSAPAPAPADPAPAESAVAPTDAPPATTPSDSPSAEVPAAPVPSDEATTDEAATEPPAAARMAPGSRAACTGSNCATLIVNASVTNTGGGTAVVTDIVTKATDTSDASLGSYIFEGSDTTTVVKNTTYSIVVTAPANYTTTVSCTGGSSWNSPNLRFSNSNNRTATCAVQATYNAPPPPASATITVKVGGDRAAGYTTSPLAGVQLRLVAGDSAPDPTKTFGAWSVCTSNAAGDCTFTVPDVQTDMTGGQGQNTGGNKGRQFWIVGASPPAGWQFNTTVKTSPGGVGTYAYRSPAMTANGTFTSTSFQTSTSLSGRYATGWFTLSRTNPTIAPSCGVRVALIFDLSTSVANSSGAPAAEKAAGAAMVNALYGTNSEVGVYSFSTGSQTELTKTAVSTASGRDTVLSAISGMSYPSGYTNWDRGFGEVPLSTYNVAIIITDGDPTTSGVGSTNNGNTRYNELEPGIASANRLKSGDTRVIAIGVGAGVSGDASNLNAVASSGAVYQTTDYSGAAQVLKDFALGNCLSSISVVKQVFPVGADTTNPANAAPAGGWTISADQPSSGVTITTPTSGTTAPNTGAINFPLTFAGGTQSGTVRISETQQTGYDIVPQSSKNAVCTVTTSSGTSVVTVTNTTVGGNPGFTVPVSSSGSVSCTIYNKKQAPAPKLTLVKQLDAAAPGASQPTAWTLTATASGQPGLSGQTGTPGATGTVTAGVAYTLGESGGPAGYAQTALSCDGGYTGVSMASPKITLKAGDNVTCTFTNKSTNATLTLVKKLDASAPGSAQPSAWTLTATSSGQPGLSGATGTPGATGVVPAGKQYTLGETGGPSGYTLTSLACDSGYGDITAAKTITLKAGENVTCTFTNKSTTGTLTLVKKLDPAAPGASAVTAWTLKATATGQAGLSGVTGTPGATGSLPAGVAFALDENGPTGYALKTLSCDSGHTEVTSSAKSITLKAGENVTCTFTNTSTTGKLTLVKVLDPSAPGTAQPTAWTLTATSAGQPGLSGSTGSQGATGLVTAGKVYTLAEAAGPADYEQSNLSCTGHNEVTSASPTITLAVGEDVTCTFTNRVAKGTLTLIKSVDNSTGGTAIASDWNGKLTATLGTTVTTFNTNVSQQVLPGTYTIGELTEGVPQGYTQTGISCVDGNTTTTVATVTLQRGHNVVCTITNKATAPTLSLEKVVVNKNGGLAKANEWTLSAIGTGGLSGPGSVSGAVRSNQAYALSETGGPAGYTLTNLVCTGHPEVTTDARSLTLRPGENVKCTFTNTDSPASLTLIKNVDNTTGGTAKDTDWNQKLIATNASSTAIAFDTKVPQTLPAGVYTLSELGGPTGYAETGLSCLPNTGFNAATKVLTIKPGDDVKCTFTNTAIAPKLTLLKVVDNSGGGLADKGDWTLTAAGPKPFSGSTGANGVITALTPYTLSETGPMGYSLKSLVCDTGYGDITATKSITLKPGENVTCTFTNKAIAPTLQLKKVVDNATGGTANASQWTLTATGGPDGFTGATGDPAHTVTAGTTYTLAESGGPSGYELTSLSCPGHPEVTTTAKSIKLGLNENVVCTFTNASIAPTVKLVKAVDNAGGGKALNTEWTLAATATGATVSYVPTGTVVTAKAGVTYTLGESTGPAGYALTTIVCDTGRGDVTTTRTITLQPDEHITCTFTNTAVAPSLQLTKVVDVSNGGNAVAGQWTLKATANGVDALNGTNGVSGVVKAGVAYTLTETNGPAGYEQINLACRVGDRVVPVVNGTVTLALADNAVCTFTNRAIAPTIKLVKAVDNANGGSAKVADWTLAATPTGGAPSYVPSGTTVTAHAGTTYSLSESAGPTGYSLSSLVCDSGYGDVLAGMAITPKPGDKITCTFTNASIAPKLTLKKVVNTPNGGSAVVTDWLLSATTAGTKVLDGPSGTAGVTGVLVKAGVAYTLDERGGPSGYDLTSLVCGDGADIRTSKTITLTPGQDVTCTFTNTDTPASLKLVKVIDTNKPGDRTAAEWNGYLAANGDPFDSGQTKDVPAGTYALSELDGAPAGYDLTSLACDDGGSTSITNATVKLTVGQHVTCTFTNSALDVKLTLVKDVVNDGGGLHQASEWTLTAQDGATAVLTGRGTQASDANSAALSGPVAPGRTYTLSEDGGPSGYTPAEAWACANDATGSDLTVTGGNHVTVPTATNVTCHIVNTAIPAAGSVTKTVTERHQNADGTWTIGYRITVTNESADSQLTYGLTDKLAFGAGITVTAASWSGAGSSGQFTSGTATLASNRVLAPSGVDMYDVTVTARVSGQAVTDETTACAEGTDNGGFRNTADLTFGSEDVVSSACTEPVAPTVTKTPVGVTENTDGTWTLTYRVTVAYPAGELNPRPATLAYSLTDDPSIPASLALVGSWTATAADATTPAPTNATWDGTGTWTIAQDQLLSADPGTATYEVTAKVKRTAAPIEVGSCEEQSGIVVGNTATVVSGPFTSDAEACLPVTYVDVSLTKTAGLGEEKTSVEPGDTFDYVLTVTNNGTHTANGVAVTDHSLNERLAIQGLTVSGTGVTWTGQPGYSGRDVDLVINDLAPGASAVITINVKFLAADTTGVDDASQLPAALNELSNKACVALEGDRDPANDCDTVTVPTRDMVAAVWTECVGDAPLLNWAVSKSDLLKGLPVALHWVPDGATPTTVPAAVDLSQPGGSSTWGGRHEWPGSAFTPSGVSVDYPGWRPIVRSDMAPGGGYYLPGTTTVMTPAEQAQDVFNGMILDPSTLDFAWRGTSEVTLSVNPSQTFTVAYPEATPDCFVARHTEVTVKKTASAKAVKPGGSLDYSLAVANVSDDSAAEGVVITDAIPATLKVTGTSWTGQGDATAFPNWQSCDVTGSDANGFGGMLTCTLFGPLQATAVAKGISVAPTITVHTTVATTARGTISNTAIVDYHTFGDPTDKGRAQSTVDVTVITPETPGNPGKPLAVTGAPAPVGLMGLSVVATLLGLGAVVLRRRRAGAGR